MKVKPKALLPLSGLPSAPSHSNYKNTIFSQRIRPSQDGDLAFLQRQNSCGQANLAFLPFLLILLGLSAGAFSYVNMKRKAQAKEAAKIYVEQARKLEAARLHLQDLEQKNKVIDESPYFRAQQIKARLGKLPASTASDQRYEDGLKKKAEKKQANSNQQEED